MRGKNILALGEISADREHISMMEKWGGINHKRQYPERRFKKGDMEEKNNPMMLHEGGV